MGMGPTCAKRAGIGGGGRRAAKAAGGAGAPAGELLDLMQKGTFVEIDGQPVLDKCLGVDFNFSKSRPAYVGTFDGTISLPLIIELFRADARPRFKVTTDGEVKYDGPVMITGVDQTGEGKSWQVLTKAGYKVYCVPTAEGGRLEPKLRA